MKLLRKWKSKLEKNMGHEISYKMFFAITISYPIAYPILIIYEKINEFISNYKYERRINKLKRNKDINKIIKIIYDEYYLNNKYQLITSYSETSISIFNFNGFNILLEIKNKYQNTYCLSQIISSKTNPLGIKYSIEENSLIDILIKMKNTLPLFKMSRRNEKLEELLK